MLVIHLRLSIPAVATAAEEDVDCFRSFFFSSRRRHTKFDCDWSSDVCSSDLLPFFHSSGLFESYFSPRNCSLHLLGKLFPPLHVGNSFFIALDDHLGALLDG